MKILVLILIIFSIFIFFRIYKSISVKNNSEKEKVIDLEKDPNTDEYKPKE